MNVRKLLHDQPAGLELMGLTGITYNPLTRAFRLSPDTGINYLAHFRL